MCARTGKPPLLVCTVGDLLPGTEYHDPNGERWMVLGAFDDRLDIDPKIDTLVVNLGNGLRGDEFKGRVTKVYSNLKLGYDDRGIRYTSTALNGWYYDPADEPDTRRTDNDDPSDANND